MAGLYFAVLCVCVHVLLCAPVHNGESQNEKHNKLLNNTLAMSNETATCESKLREAYIQMANYKRQKTDLQTWMTQISQAIVHQQQLMTKLHIDIDTFLGWAHGPNGTLQFALINESFVSNETDGPEDVDVWDEDFQSSRRAGWLTQQNLMNEGQIRPESPSEPKPGLVEPLEVVDYEEEGGGLSVQTENEEEEAGDNEKDLGETVISKEITEADEKPEPPRKADVTGTVVQRITEIIPGSTASSLLKPIAAHHKPGNKKPTEKENVEQKNQLETENEPVETEKEPMETKNEKLENENELQKNEPQETEPQEKETEPNEPQENKNEPQENENEPQENENEPQENENEPQENENEPKENENEQNENKEEKEAETGQEEEGKEEALQIDEGPQEYTGRSANSKPGRKLLGFETAEMSKTKSKGHGTGRKTKANHTVHDLRKRMDACISVVSHRQGFNKLHGMERNTEQNTASQKVKVLECVLDVIKEMPVARQNAIMSRLQRFLETIEHRAQ